MSLRFVVKTTNLGPGGNVMSESLETLVFDLPALETALSGNGTYTGKALVGVAIEEPTEQDSEVRP